MDLQKFYESMGVDYEKVLNRLRREDRIEKYLRMMLADESFGSLKAAVKSKDYQSAFMAAHTIKGVSLNLELTPLAKTADKLTEYLRCYQSDTSKIDEYEADMLYQDVQKEYDKLYEAIEG